VAGLLLREAALSDGLVDLLDRLVDTGVAADGDVTISVAGVDLIALRLQALLASVGTDGAGDLSFPSRSRSRPRRALPARIETDGESLQRGLAQLVLVVVELVGELLERQALRRLAAGTLDDEQARRLGEAFVALHARLDELHDELLGESHPSGVPEPRRPGISTSVDHRSWTSGSVAERVGRQAAARPTRSFDYTREEPCRPPWLT